jgi:hypothetical protein
MQNFTTSPLHFPYSLEFHSTTLLQMQKSQREDLDLWMILNYRDLWMILNVEFWGIWKEATVTSFSTGIRLEKIKKIKIDNNFQH